MSQSQENPKYKVESRYVSTDLVEPCLNIVPKYTYTAIVDKWTEGGI